MTDHDAAFLWETSALRSTQQRAEAQTSVSPGWVTLREAHRTTGVPIDTIRKWGRQGSVPSMVVETEAGPRRLVRLESVIGRARHQGRTVAEDRDGEYSVGETEPPTASDVADGDAAAESLQPLAPAAVDTAAATSTAPPEGNMIVPIEAWDRMLMQLGNLHEAGQQLAEARERAARAETEAEFLRERLAEMRTTASTARAVGDPASEATEPESRPAAAPKGPSVPTARVWEYALRRWRLRRGR